jgi:hypothetical protein
MKPSGAKQATDDGRRTTDATSEAKFTRAELQVLKAWLGALGFQGNRADLKSALALYDRIIEKIDAALAGTQEELGGDTPVPGEQ